MAKNTSAKSSPLLSWAWILALPLALAVTIGGGALIVRMTPASPAVALGAAIAATVLSTLLFPLLIDRKITLAYRAIDPTATGSAAQTIALWNAIVLGLLVLLIPHRMGTALQLHGDWMFHSVHSPVANQARTQLHKLGVWLAREEIAPLQLPTPRVATPPRTDAGVANVRAEVRDASAPAVEPRDRAFTSQELFQFRSDTVAVLTVRLHPSSESRLANQVGINTTIASGSGFVVDGDGLIVTNSHVIHGARSIRVALRDGREFTTVTLLAEDRSNDLALLRVDARNLHASVVSQDDNIAVGTHVSAIGNPLGYERTLTDGIISAVRDVHGTTMLQSNVAIAPGSSGGPLFDDRGRVLGVTTATGRAGVNFAVHPRHVRALLARPREARALETFVPEGVVEELRVEGAETDPVERLNLDSLARQVSSSIEDCVLQNTTGTFFTQRFETNQTGISFAANPREESDFSQAGTRCIRTQLSLLSHAVAMVITRAHEAELSSEHPLVFRLRIQFPATSTRTARSLQLRFEFLQRASDAGTSDADDSDAAEETTP